MPGRTDLHGYQEHCVQHVLDHPYCGLFLDMGLGKTVSCLTALDDLMFNRMEVGKVLVVAPKRVAQHTWTSEIAKWSHLSHFRVSRILGTAQERIKALRASVDLYVINRENLVWLISYLGGAWPFDTVVLDELSSFKSAKSQRFKALRKVRPRIKRVIGLTGTPAPNSLLDLWPQLYLLDQGERLGKTLGGYREQYFKEDKRVGQFVSTYKIKPGEAEKKIYDRLGDICISMKAEDYLELPERLDIVEEAVFSPEVMDLYRKFEADAVLKVIGEGEITAVNAAALGNKLLQFTNGAVYDEDRNVHEIHDLKLDVLEELVEAANGDPVLVFYNFRHDIPRIEKRLGKVTILKDERQVDMWNDGKIKILLAHAASAGHGLNMQQGGHTLVWFGLPWSLELYQQAVARLHRQGQINTVANYMISAPGTIDFDVIKALERKEKTQDALLDAVKARIFQIRKKFS